MITCIQRTKNFRNWTTDEKLLTPTEELIKLRMAKIDLFISVHACLKKHRLKRTWSISKKNPTIYKLRKVSFLTKQYIIDLEKYLVRYRGYKGGKQYERK